MNFWDYCAPVYDFAEKTNKKAYKGMIEKVIDVIPNDASVLECATGTASIGIAVSKKASTVLATDTSSKMLNIAKRKAVKNQITNINFEIADIYHLNYADNSFDIVIASQVLHLLDEPQKAVDELKRVAKVMVISPLALIDNVTFPYNLKIGIWKLLGFSPVHNFNEKSYHVFLEKLDLNSDEYFIIDGKLPMVVPVHKI